MSPLILLIIVLVILLLCVAALIINHLFGGRMANSDNGVVVHVAKWKAAEVAEVPPIEEEVEKKPSSKHRERADVEIKPPEVLPTPVIVHSNKAEVRKKLRRNMMKSEIWNRIWS